MSINLCIGDLSSRKDVLSNPRKRTPRSFRNADGKPVRLRGENSRGNLMRRRISALALVALVGAGCSASSSHPPLATLASTPSPSSTTAAIEPSSAKPEVTCEGDVGDCERETLAVLDAVSRVNRRVIRIVFRANATCIWFPFGGGPCGSVAVPTQTRHVSNAVVTFEGTDQQAFLNVFSLTNGSTSTDLALVTPPPGATPVD